MLVVKSKSFYSLFLSQDRFKHDKNYWFMLPSKLSSQYFTILCIAYINIVQEYCVNKYISYSEFRKN